MAPHSSALAWKIPPMEDPGGLQSMGREELDTTERLHFDFSLSYIGEGNGNQLQCSCLENPRDSRAWWAAVYGVAQSRTRLKRLSSSSSSSSSSAQKGFRAQEPHKVLLSFTISLGPKEIPFSFPALHFCLEHIPSSFVLLKIYF